MKVGKLEIKSLKEQLQSWSKGDVTTWVVAVGRERN